MTSLRIPVLGPLVLSGLLLTVTAAAADIGCRAEVDRRVVAPGGQVILTLHAQGDLGQGPSFGTPRIEGVEVVPGGTSQSFQLVNGRSEHSLTITYYLVVRRNDDFQVPSLTLAAGGQTCRTESISITVDPGAARNSTGASGSTADEQSRAGGPGDAYFITLEVDRDEVWVGQQVLLSFRFYHGKNPWNQPSYTAPRTEGFWRVDLPPERNFRQTVRGQVYEVTEIRYAMFPTRAGELIIEPARLEIAGDPFQRLFGRRSRGPVVLVTEPIAVTVKDLPLPRPDTFSGIVADRLSFTATVDRDTVPRGEPLSLHLEVQADAFLKSFGGVPVAGPAGVQLHDAAEHLREDVNGPRYQATFVQEKALVPTQEGRLDLGSLELSYFDTGQSRYRRVAATLPPVVVTPSDRPTVGDDPSGFRRTEIARLGHDLAFVHRWNGAGHGPSFLTVGRPVWWGLLALPWLCLLAWRWYLGRRDADRRDPVGVRRRQALAVARQRLAAAGAASDADALARAIVGFVADRQGGTAAGLTATDIQRWADELGHPEAGTRLVQVLSQCDQARFGGGQSANLQHVADEVAAILPTLIVQRTEPPRLATLLLVCCLGAALAGSALGAPGADPARLLAEGNQAYTEGDLEVALQRYLEARDLGLDVAPLHYNLGNTHARRGELGPAIASYLRARRLAPRDGDIRRNLEWVRQHTRDLDLVAGSLPPVVAQLDGAAHLLAVREWGWLLLVLSWLPALVLARRWWRDEFSPGARRVFTGLAGLLLVVAVITFTRWYEEHGRQTAVVVVEEVEVRSGPATTFPVTFRIHDGLVLEVRGEREGWNRVGLGGDWVGWVPAGSLEFVAQGR